MRYWVYYSTQLCFWFRLDRNLSQKCTGPTSFEKAFRRGRPLNILHDSQGRSVPGSVDSNIHISNYRFGSGGFLTWAFLVFGLLCRRAASDSITLLGKSRNYGMMKLLESINSSEKFQISPPNICRGDCDPSEQNPNHKWQVCTSCGRHSCHRSVQTLLHAMPCALDELLLPVLLDSVFSSCCCNFPSKFCVGGKTHFFKPKFGTTPQKRPNHDQNLWVGLTGTNKPPSGKQSLHYGRTRNRGMCGHGPSSRGKIFTWNFEYKPTVKESFLDPKWLIRYLPPA